MTCQICQQQFESSEWMYVQELFPVSMIICDECLLDVYDARMENMEKEYVMIKDKFEKLAVVVLEKRSRFGRNGK